MHPVSARAGNGGSVHADLYACQKMHARDTIERRVSYLFVQIACAISLEYQQFAVNQLSVRGTVDHELDEPGPTTACPQKSGDDRGQER